MAAHAQGPSLASEACPDLSWPGDRQQSCQEVLSGLVVDLDWSVDCRDTRRGARQVRWESWCGTGPARIPALRRGYFLCTGPRRPDVAVHSAVRAHAWLVV